MKRIGADIHTMVDPQMTTNVAELNQIREQVDGIMTKLKMSHPITRENFQDICKEMNLKVTHLQTIEAILHYRNNKNIDTKDNEDYSYDKLLRFFHRQVKNLPAYDLHKPLSNFSRRNLAMAQSQSGRLMTPIMNSR